MAKRIQRQLKKQLEEQKSLEEELDKLQSAKNPKDSCQEVIKFIQSSSQDPIDDTENNPFIAPTCFVAGTEILVNKLGKHKNIEDLQIGDVVMCLIPTHMSFKESIEGYKIEDIPKLFTEASVTNIYTSLSHHICNIKFRNLTSNEERTVECTESHPIYVHEQGWKTVSGEMNGKERYDFEIKKLEVGDNVCLESGELACITDIDRTPLTNPVLVYNLTVSEGHTFFANGLFVHNKCPCVIL